MCGFLDGKAYGLRKRAVAFRRGKVRQGKVPHQMLAKLCCNNQDSLSEKRTTDILLRNTRDYMERLRTMKWLSKALCAVCFCLALTALLSVEAAAGEVSYAVTGGNIYFDAATGTVTGCDSGVTLANIPSEIESVSVTAIADRAFSGKRISTVIIPSSVTAIGDYAFSNCFNLNAAAIRGNGLVSVGEYAFNSTALRSVNLPDSVTEVGQRAFADCKALTSVSVGATAKAGTVSTIIGSEAFLQCSALNKVVLGDGVTEIGEYAFFCCGALKDLTLGSEIRSIGGFCFYQCTALKEVTIPNQVATVKEQTFMYSGLTSVTIPASVTTIEAGAFYASALSEVRYGGSPSEWEKIQFSGSAHQYIQQANIFYGKEDSELPGEDADAPVTTWQAVGGLLHFDPETGAITDCDSGVTEAAIPEEIGGVTVTTIGNRAFYGNDSLKTLTIPDTVTIIEDLAFVQCGVTSLEIPESVVSIGDMAFFQCFFLEEISFPDSLSSIGYRAFFNCEGLHKANRLDLGNGVSRIGEEAFAECGPISILVLPASLSDVGSNAFYGCTITNVMYAGARADWLAMSIGSGNTALTSSSIWFLGEDGSLEDQKDLFNEDYSYPAGWFSICDEYAWQTLLLTNKERAKQNLLPLSAFPALQAAANIRAEELTEEYSHTRPNGSSGLTVLEQCGLTTATAGENIARGQSTAQTVVNDWMNSEGHRANILSTDFNHGGMGYCADHWGQLFMINYCTPRSIRVLPGESGTLRIPVGGCVEDMGAAVELCCDEHGACYIPLMEEMCSGADSSTAGDRTVTVCYSSLSCTFTLSVYEDTSYTKTVNGLTMQISGGEATVTDWDGKAEHVTIPDEVDGYPVSAIGPNVFNSRLSSVTLPEGLEEIGDRAFYGSGITSIELPKRLRRIGQNAFANSGLTGTVHIPASVKDIQPYAFTYLGHVTAFEVHEDNRYYCDDNGVLYDAKKTVLMSYPLASTNSTYVVPDSVTKLYCTSLARTRNLKNLYVTSPSISAMTYALSESNFTLWCSPVTNLYKNITNGRLKNVEGITLRTFPDYSVQADTGSIRVSLAGAYAQGRYYLAAYSGQGQLLTVKTVSGVGQQTYAFPGTDRTHSIQLFSLDEDLVPMNRPTAIWSAEGPF